jgi:F-type H+-transporting ATPase subunit gamma
LQVSAVAEDLLKTEYDAVRIIYNRFVSAISFKPTIATILSPDVCPSPAGISGPLRNISSMTV